MILDDQQNSKFKIQKTEKPLEPGFKGIRHCYKVLNKEKLIQDVNTNSYLNLLLFTQIVRPKRLTVKIK